MSLSGLFYSTLIIYIVTLSNEGETSKQDGGPEPSAFERKRNGKENIEEIEFEFSPSKISLSFFIFFYK
jgi:hypothetical protein